MSLRKNISRIKNLDSIKPDKRWQSTTKYDLLEEISSQNRLMQAYKLSNTQKIDLFVMRVTNRLAPSMTKALTAFLVFMMFFGVNIAAQASVPGEPLWPVKRSIEEAEIALTFSPVNKTLVHIEHVGERLDEIDKILKELAREETKVQKDKAVKQAITHLEKDVSSVDSALRIVKEEKKPIEVVELAKKVTDATKEVDNKLAEKKKEVQTDNKELGEAINNAKILNKQVKKSAVAVAIKVHEEVQKSAEANKVAINLTNTTSTTDESLGPKVGSLETTTPVYIVTPTVADDATVSEADAVSQLVKEILASEINDLSEEVKDVKQKVEVVDQEALNTIKKDAVGEQDSNKIISSELDEFDVIKQESSQDSEVVLAEAQVLLDNGQFKDAFDKVSQANEKYEKAEVTLEKIGQAIEVNKILGEAKNIDDKIPVIIMNPQSTSTASTTDIIYIDTGDTTTSTASSSIDIKTEDTDTIKPSGIDIKDSSLETEEEQL